MNAKDMTVRKSGGICPSLILIFSSKGVNNGKIWVFSENLTVVKTSSLDSFCIPKVAALHTNDSKEGSQYWPNYAFWYGQIPLDFMTRPCFNQMIYYRKLRKCFNFPVRTSVMGTTNNDLERGGSKKKSNFKAIPHKKI